MVDDVIFDGEFQDKVIACMLKVSGFNSVACQYVKPKHFEGSVYHNIAKVIIDYSTNYNATISDFAFIDIIRKQFEKDKDNLLAHLKVFGHIKTVSVIDSDYVLERLVEFIKQRAWKGFIELAVDDLAKGKSSILKSLEVEATKIINISALPNSDGYEYYDVDNIESRAEARIASLAEMHGIKTGIKELDIKLNNRGFLAGEMTLILGSSKRGKTQLLLWLCNNASKNGFNAVYFSCEVSRRVICDRLDALNSNTLINALITKSSDVVDTLKSSIPKGKIRIFEYPTKTLSVSQIEECLKRLEKQEGFKPDIVMVDYLDLLKPALRDADVLKQQANIAEDLRGIAGKFQVPLITASQINRAGTGKAVNSGTDIAGSFEKIAVADLVLCLSATDDELRNNELKIIISESRNSGSGVIKIKTAFGYGKFYDKTVGISED